MKKFLTIIGIMLVAICSVFVGTGCNEDKYANMSIEVSSAALTGDTLTIGYGNSIELTAKATGADGINNAVNFNCSDTEALDITGVTNSENGTKAVIKANKPTYDNNYFVLKVSSVETNRVYRELKVKVVLPIEGLDFGGAKLSVSPSNPISLASYIKFYPQKPYVTNQKDVVYTISDYGFNNANSIYLDQAGNLSVTADVVENMTTDDNCLEITAVSKSNTGIKNTIKVNVVKDLADSDLAIESSQLSYNSELVADKLKLNLFTNSTKYYRENVIVYVNSSQDIDIEPIKVGDGNTIEITKGAITKTPIDGTRYRNKITFEIRAKSAAGICGVKFKVTTKNISNPVEFEFSDDTMIEVVTSALPKAISLKQDGRDITIGDTISVYNEYIATETISGHGSKLVPFVTSASSTSVNERNKHVRVELIDIATENDALTEFTFTDVRGNVLDNTNGFLEMISNNILYIKALDTAVGKTYKLTFTTIISDFITYASGGSPSVEDEIITVEYFISANYGVNQITFEKDNYVIKRSQMNDNLYTETLINFSVNENADISGMTASYDASMLTVTKLDTFSYVVVGTTLGTTEFRITAKNGCTKKVTIRIVDPVKVLSLSVDNPATSQVISEAEYEDIVVGDNYTINKLVKVSAKVGGKFNVYANTSPNLTGILKTEFKSLDPTIVSISNSGIITTKNSGTTTITATIQYYEFTYGEDGYAKCSINTTDISFEIIVYTPTTSIGLNRYTATIYSEDSLGYDYKELSYVEVHAQISPVTATVYGDESAVTYNLVNNNGILTEASGTKGRYQAKLPEGVNEATVMIVVTVKEYGSSVSLVCNVTIKRATQIKEITIDNLPKRNGVYVLDMKEDATFNLEITLSPEKVFIQDLFFMIYDEEMTPIHTGTIVTVNGKAIVSKAVLQDADPNSVFVRVFAKDSMTGEDSGSVYETILVTIERGTLESPYLINSADDLQAIKNAPTKHYMLARDIDLNSRSWEPIANFSGSLNGLYYRKAGGTEIKNQYKITNLSLESSDGEYVGLFANIELTGLVMNLDVSVSSVTISNNRNLKAVGTIAAYNNGIIVNSTVSIGNNFVVSTSGNTAIAEDIFVDIGGMVGTNNGWVYNFVPYITDVFGNYGRAYTAFDLKDTSIPDKYIELVAGKDSFLYFAELYAEGDNPAHTAEQVAIMIAESISETPVHGRIQVMDSMTCPINVGGLVGRNLHVVNGIFGLYNVQEEISGLESGDGGDNQFLIDSAISATINDAGRDFSGTIYTGGRDLNKSSSTIGGIVGLNTKNADNEEARVYNVATSGRVEGYYNVGGIVGKSTGGIINTISSCARISGINYVGGAVGYADNTTIHLVKVENYQETTAGGDILIKGMTYVGGVVGYIDNNSTLEFAYSVSFVEESTFTAGGVANQTADIYGIGNYMEMYFGGVAGYVGVNTELAYVYSTMSIYMAQTTNGAYAGGIAGSLVYRGKIHDAYYLGKFIRVSDTSTGVVAGKIDSMGLATVEGVDGIIKNFFSNNSRKKVGEDTASAFNNSESTVINNVIQAQQLEPFKTAVAGSANWNTTDTLNTRNGVAFPIIKYTSELIKKEVFLLKQTPTAVTAAVTETPSSDYKKLQSTVLLLTYSVNESKNVYSLNSLLKFTWSPASIKSSQLRVTSSNTSVVSVQEGGKIVVQDVSSMGGVGYATLTFTSVLNLNAYCTVDIIVVPKVTDVKLFNDSNLTQDILESSSLSMKKDTTQKLFPTFYDTDENGKLVKVNANYGIQYSYKTPNEYYDIDATSNIISAKKETLTEADADYASQKEFYDISFTSKLTFTYSFGNEIKTFNYNPFESQAQSGKRTFSVSIYTGATDLIVSPNSEIEVSGYIPQSLLINLVSDAKIDGVKVVITDDNGNTIYKRHEAGATMLYINNVSYNMDIAEERENAQKILDEIGFVLDIDVLETEFLMTPGNLEKLLNIQIAEGKEYMINPVGYTFEFSAVTNSDVSCSVRVLAVPQALLHLDTDYRVLEGSEVSGEGKTSYIFDPTPKNKLVPGKLGLISIDTNPVFAGVKYFKVETSAEAMKYVSLAQLYKDTSAGASGLSYIFGTNAEKIENGIILNRKSNYLKTIYTYKNGVESDVPIEDSNNYNNEIIKVEQQYDYDGNLYVEILTASNIYEIESFPIYVTAVFADGSEQKYTRVFETTYIPALSLEATRRYIALGSRVNDDGAETKDSIKVTPKVDGDYDISMDITVLNAAGTGEGVAVLTNDGTLVLSNNAQMGDVIRVTASYSITVEGRSELVSTSIDILVVEAVIDEVSIDKIVDNKLLFTISSSQQLQATLKGCANQEQGVLSRLATTLSRQMTDSNAVAYWKYVYNNGEVTNLDNKALSLPFGIDVKKVASGTGGNLASVSLVGSTVSGSANLMLKAYMYYTDGGELRFAEMVDETAHFPSLIEVPFVAQVMVDSTDDLPTPIYTVSELMNMAEGGNYILMNDLDITTPHTPITTAIGSLDGNNKVITISNFAYDTSTDSISSGTINLGLFSTISAGTVIKNVIVALPNDKANPMMLNSYTNINYGGLAGINYGIVTNCEVISVYDKDTYNNAKGNATDTSTDEYLYPYINYTNNIYTAVQVNGTAVTANVGGLIGTNAETGVITNSRVGRNYVEYVSIQSDDYNGTNPDLKVYEYTAPITIMKLEGTGNVGGFVAVNAGIISSSYFNNGQLEISSYGSNYTRTGGFVAINSGAVYSSYAAGWEEESYIKLNDATNDLYDTLLATNPDGNVHYQVKSSQTNPNRKLGGGIFSNGNIGGFVFNNSGYIQNSYSSIRLDGDFTFAANRQNISSNANLNEYGNLNAGGFVFINDENSQIKTSYTISKIKSNISTHGPFVGVSPSSGDVQNSGEVNKCYYLVESGESIYSKVDPAYDISQTSDSELGEDVASIGNEFVIKDTFAGFSFDNSNYVDGMTSGAVWAMKMVTSSFATGSNGQDSYGYPEIVSANQIAISVRVLKPSASGEGQADYSYIYALGYEKGSSINPQIITSATDYNKVFESILGVTTNVENVNVKYTGNMRLVNNLDFTSLTPMSTSFEYTSPVNSLSVFDGNNLSISNVLISDDSEENTAFGLFKVFNDVGVKNITLSIRGVDSTNGIAVGALAGLAVESDINNINVVSAIEGAEVSGQNYVGGLAGIVVSGDDYTMHYINNINCNVSVLAGYNGGENTQIIKPGEIWSLICPPAKINKYSTDYNLRLQYLKSNVSYAGGVAGVIDLVQAFKSSGEDASTDSLDNINARAINVSKLDIFYNPSDVEVYEDNVISIEAAYTGGLFGFVGNETFIREASFVAYEMSEKHYIMADIAAGGITAINYGFIDQTSVSFDKETQAILDNQLENLVKGATSITWGNQNLYTGAPIYLGGIAGINIGGAVKNTGTIQNSYNRVDLINDKATRIGGIAGASHIGAFVNDYTTANVKGDFSQENSYFGAVIGQLLNNENNRYYSISLSKDQENKYNLEITNITTAILWNPEYYDEYKKYTNDYGMKYYETYKSGEPYRETDPRYNADNPTKEAEDGLYVRSESNNRVVSKIGRIGAIYGAPTKADETNLRASELEGESGVKNKNNYFNPYLWYDHYVNKFSGSSTVLVDKIYKSFTESSEEYVDLYTGTQHHDVDKIAAGVTNGDKYEVYKNYKGKEDYALKEPGNLYYFLNYDESQYVNNILSKDELYDLYTLEVGAGSNAKDKAFSKSYWSSRIWKFDDSERLITLNFGYIPSIARIYTAEDYIREINDSPASKKYYYIMNDIDFSTLTGNKDKDAVIVRSNFRGTVTGIKQYNEDRTKSRYPILYNIELTDKLSGDSGGTELNEMALFVNTTNASFFNLNIVLKSYKENVPGTGTSAFIKKSAVLIASSNNTSINNIHIGYRLADFAEGFVTEGTGGVRAVKRDKDVDDGGNLDSFNSYISTNFVKGGQSNVVINTFATYFGGLVADSISTKIRDCSFNIPIQAGYYNRLLPADSEVFLGGLVGKLLGSVTTSFVTKKISASAATDSNSTFNNAKYVYIGGVIGYGAGDISNIGYGRPSGTNNDNTFIKSWKRLADKNTVLDSGLLNVYTNGTYSIEARSKTYIGGVIGLSTILIDTTSTLVSSVSSAYAYNVTIMVNIGKLVNVGGVIGRNEISVTNLQYRSKKLNTDYEEVFATNYANDSHIMLIDANQNIDSSIGGIIGDNGSDSKIENAMNNVTMYVKNVNGTTVNIGGILGTTKGLSLYKSVNDAYGIRVLQKGKTVSGLTTEANTNIGGLVGQSTNSDLSLNYVLSSAYIEIEDGSSGRTNVGGLIGYGNNSGVIIYTVVSLGNIYIAKDIISSGLNAGGIAGQVRNFSRNSTGFGNGAVVACNINYRNIGSRSTFNIGQILGSISGSTVPGQANFKDIYFSENLFGLYINSYTGGTTYNVNMEDLAEKIDFIAKYMRGDSSDNIFRDYFKQFADSKTNIYESSLERIIYFDGTDYKGFEGGKINPKVLGDNPNAELGSTTYTYYKLIKDVTASTTISNLNKGNFIDCRGYTINNGKTLSVFETIDREAFVVGLLVDGANATSKPGTNAGIIADVNSGTLLGCGTSGNLNAIGGVSGGVVGCNYGNIINCFSIANITITTDGSKVGGLVGFNLGNIITSYYTGVIDHTVDYSTATDLQIGGLVLANIGNIANSYTMSNILDAGLVKAVASNVIGSIYSIASNTNLINVYYDINAYTGPAVSYTDKGKTTAQLSTLGTLTGIPIAGNWFIADNNDIKKLYMRENTGELESRIYVNSSWFNYSYSIANVNGNIPTVAGIKRFLNMLYTGNGRKEDGQKTNGFINQPFRITNAGMIEAYFRTSNGKAETSYYILQNDISFKSYSNWSEEWEKATGDKQIIFTGDFNGNGKTMYGIRYSKYGIFRALGKNANIYNFTITDANSETGLIAGGMISGAKISNVTINSVAPNNNNDGVCSVMPKGATSLGPNVYNNLFVGGTLLGYMSGGEITNITLLGSIAVGDYIAYIGAYSGGLVGYATGGTIDIAGNNQTAECNPFANMTSVNVSGKVVGGLIGHSEIAIKNYILDDTVTLDTSNRAGGFVGEQKADSTEITLVGLKNTGVRINTNSSDSILGGIVGEIKASVHATKVTLQACVVEGITIGSTYQYSYIGGLVGRADYVKFNGGTVKNTTLEGYIVGGYVGESIAYIEFIAQDKGDYNEGSSFTGSIVGGIVGKAVNGVISGTDAKPINNKAYIYAREQTVDTTTSNGNIIGSISVNSGYKYANESKAYAFEISNITADLSNLKHAGGEYSISNTGGVVGYVSAQSSVAVSIHNCEVTGVGSPEAFNYGGIVGYANNLVSISDIHGQNFLIEISIIKNNDDGNSYYIDNVIGGVVGKFDNAVITSLVPYNISNISNFDFDIIDSDSIDTSDVSGSFQLYIGGIVGKAYNTKINSININVNAVLTNTVSSSNLGGVAGYVVSSNSTSAEINNVVLNIINLEGKSYDYVGGVAGQSASSTTTNTILGKVTITLEDNALIGNSYYSGGVVGVSSNTNFAGNITITSKATTNNPKITSSADAGGIIGKGYLVSFSKADHKINANTSCLPLNISTSYGAGGLAGQIEMSGILDKNVKFTSNANVRSDYYAGGLIGLMTSGEIDYTGAETSIIINGDVASPDIGYLIGRISSSSTISIKNITVPTETTTSIKNFSFSPVSSATTRANVGIFIGYITTTNSANVELSKLTNNYSKDFGDASILNLGGIVGYISSGSNFTISGCKNNGSLTSNIATYLGGIAGNVTSRGSIILKVTDCENKKAITDLADTDDICSYVGGIFGTATNVKLTNCKNSGDIYSTYSAGGLCGITDKEVTIFSNKTTSDSDVPTNNIQSGDYGYAGGYIGVGKGTVIISGDSNINNLKLKYNVTGGKYIGGAIGYTVSSNVSISDVTVLGGTISAFNDGSYAGGLIGYVTKGNNDSISIENCKINDASISAEGSTDNESNPLVGSNGGVGGIVGALNETVGVKIKKVTITKNNIVPYGNTPIIVGGIVGQIISSTISFANNSVSNNTIGSDTFAVFAGGAVGKATKLTNFTDNTSTFNSNTVSSTSYSSGYAGYLDTNDFRLRDVTVSNSTITSKSTKSSSEETLSSGALFGELKYSLSSDFTVSLQSNKIRTYRDSNYNWGYAGVVAGRVLGVPTGEDKYAGLIDGYYITLDSSNSLEGSCMGLFGQIEKTELFLMIIENYVKFTKVGTSVGYVGGLVGQAIDSYIDYCTTSYNIDVYPANNDIKNSSTSYYIGGIAGSITNTDIEVAKFTSSISFMSGQSYQSAGGIVGELNSSSSVKSCNVSANIETNYRAGGIIGSSWGSKSASVYNCKYLSGYVEVSSREINDGSRATYVGGIVAYAMGPLAITSCKITSNTSVYCFNYTPITTASGISLTQNNDYSKLIYSPETESSYNNTAYEAAAGGIVGYAYCDSRSGAFTMSYCSADGRAYAAYTSNSFLKHRLYVTQGESGPIYPASDGWANAYIRMYSGAIIGRAELNVSASNCRYSSQLGDIYKLTKGCGGRFQGSSSWSWWGSDKGKCTSSAIQNAFTSSNGRKEGFTAGISEY